MATLKIYFNCPSYFTMLLLFLVQQHIKVGGFKPSIFFVQGICLNQLSYIHVAILSCYYNLNSFLSSFFMVQLFQ